MEKGYQLIESESGVPIKAWTKGVAIEAVAEKQLRNVVAMPFVYKWVAAMPDVHWGIGATVGSVIPAKGAIIPSAGLRLRGVEREVWSERCPIRAGHPPLCVAVNEDVAESYDAAVFANPRSDCLIELGELRQRFADDLELALHGGTEHGVSLVALKTFAGGEFGQSLRSLVDVV